MTKREGVICAGNWIVDFVHDIDHWPNESELALIGRQKRGIGGGAANVVSALAKLDTGLPLYPMGAIGDDSEGAFILEECRKLGLPTTGIFAKPGIATAHTHVMSVAGQSRTFFYQGGANDKLAVADFPIGTFTDTPARVFYLGYLTLLGKLDEETKEGSTNAAEILRRAKSAGLATCVDLVSLHHPRFREIVTSASPHLDFLIANEIEAAFATGLQPSGNASELLQRARALLALGVQGAVVIHSAERVVWMGRDGTELCVEVESVAPEKIVSSLGAGDAFCAGLLFGIHQDLPPDRSVSIANSVARASLQGLTATSAIPPLSTLKF